MSDPKSQEKLVGHFPETIIVDDPHAPEWHGINIASDAPEHIKEWGRRQNDEWRKLYEQEWPAPTPLEIECHEKFGAEVALRLINEAHKAAGSPPDNLPFEDALRGRMIERERRERGDEPRISDFLRDWL